MHTLICILALMAVQKLGLGAKMVINNRKPKPKMHSHTDGAVPDTGPSSQLR